MQGLSVVEETGGCGKEALCFKNITGSYGVRNAR